MKVIIDKDVFDSTMSIIDESVNNIFCDKYNKAELKSIRSALKTIKLMRRVIKK